MLGFGFEYGRVTSDVLRLKRYMTSGSWMIGMEERGSDGSYSSASSSFSLAAGSENLEGQGAEPRLTDTRPAPLLKRSLIFYAFFFTVDMTLHMNVLK